MHVTSEQILDIIENAGVSADVAAMKSHQSFKDAGIDSLEMMNVFLAIEQTFDIKIEDEEIDALTSVDAVVSYLNQL